MEIKNIQLFNKIKGKCTVIKDRVVKSIKSTVTKTVCLALVMTTLTGCAVTSETITNTPELTSTPPTYESVVTPEPVASTDEISSVSTSQEVVTPSTINEVPSTPTEGTTEDKITITDDSFDIFNNYLDTNNVIYTYEDLYHVDEALSAVGDITICNNHTHLISDIDQQVTIDLLTRSIKNNNSPYLKEHPECYNLPDHEIEEFANYIINSLHNKYELLTEESKGRLYCELGNLKVVGIDQSSVPEYDQYNAQYTFDGAFILNEKRISELKDPNAKEKTYKHEINHLYHRSCIDNFHEDYEIVGISRFSYNVDVNPLFWRWQYEAAAESDVMTEYHTTESLVYEDYVNYLRSMDLVALISPKYNEQALENSTINQNPNDLYAIFNASTPEEQKEVINMMYSVDYLHLTRDDFNFSYESTYNSYNDINATKYNMKASIFTTLSKYFYRNLAERVKNDNVTIEDIFYLIKVFETDLNSHLYIYTDDPTIKEANVYFMTEYITMQNEFFMMLANNQKDIFYDIIDCQATYTSSFTIPTLSWLTPEEKEYITSLNANNQSYQTTNLRNLYDINKATYRTK